MLNAYSNTEEDQLEWHGFVESKVRHLILNLEREAIELAHVWPKTYPSLEEGREKTCCYWFVGLVIKTQPSSESGQSPNLDLTAPITKFTELVMKTSENIGVSLRLIVLNFCYFSQKVLIADLGFSKVSCLSYDKFSKLPKVSNLSNGR